VLTPDAVPAPDNVTVREYVPHEAVLPHMAAVVTHAGMSTVATALAAGVPMVCVPQGRDQPLNAARVQELGAGLMITADIAADALAQAVHTVLTDSRYQMEAQRLAAKTAAIGNGDLAAALVETLTAADVRQQGAGQAGQ
jgi:MGT family glycosyltransferase